MAVYLTITSCLTLTVISSSIAPSPPTLPNIGFLGRGYDLIKGNPQPSVSNVVDQGWTLQVMNLSYNQHQTTSDQRYSIPDGTEALSESGCSFEALADINYGETSYSQYLSKSVAVTESANAIIGKESFSASTTYQSFSSSTYKYGSIYVASHAICPAYQASLVPDEFKLRDDFIAEANDLPLTFDPKNSDDPYYQFIRTYGTNYATTIYMGSKYTRTFEFSSQSWTTMNWNEWDISTTASVEFAVATNSVSTDQRGLVNQSYQYSQMSENLYQTVLGTSAVDMRGNLSLWASQSKVDPYPYSYKLNGIDYLFDSKYMPNVSNISTKAQLLVNALNNYCNITTGCGSHSNDIHPLVIQEYNASIQSNTNSVKCPQGFVAISCGYQVINSNGKNDLFWAVYPSNEYTCTGKNTYTAKVFAVCAPQDIATGWTAVNAAITEHDIDLKCPSSHKVTGCGLKINNPGNGNSEKYWQVYPLSDSSGCHCYTYFGGECYATCVKSVNNSRVYSNSGTGTIKQQCEGEPIVFGCGIAITYLHNDDYEKWPQFYANDYNSCLGYSHHAFTVYAVCGSLGDNIQQNKKIHRVYS